MHSRLRKGLKSGPLVDGRSSRESSLRRRNAGSKEGGARAGLLTLWRMVVVVLLLGAGAGAQAQTDITAQVEQGLDVALTGGSYVIRVPALGVGGTITAVAANAYAKYDLTCYSCGHYVSPMTPSLVYRGTISGTGVVLVTNANSTVNPTNAAGGAQSPFTGGMLLITNPQTFTSGGAAPSLLIDGNTVVAFDKGQGIDLGGSFDPDSANARNVTNNGYLYSYNNRAGQQNSWGSITSTQAGAGVVTFENGNLLTDGSQYNGVVFDMNASVVQPQASFPSPGVPFAQVTGLTFQTLGPNYLMQGTTLSYEGVYGGNLYSFGANTTIAGKGVQVFTGQSVASTGSTKKDLIPASEARAFDYIGSLAGGVGQVFSIQASMQMGDGQPIVDNGDGTNNTFLQTNIEGVGNGLTIGGFAVPVNLQQALLNNAMAFDYSGTYTYDAGMNVKYTSQGVTAVSANYGNLVVMNPDPANTGKAPNHLIVTSPLFMDGITQIDQNTILQFGDGTPGNRYSKTVTVGGVSYTGIYSSSYGNGMILSHENALTARAQNPGVFFSVPLVDEIIDNGLLIVDNIPGALDMTQSDVTISSFLGINELDTITGTGGLKQEGTLPLTLEENTSYTGGTEIADGTLYLTTSTAGVPPSIASSSGVTLSGPGAVFDISRGGNQTIQDLSGVSGSTVNLGANTLSAGTSNSTSFLGTMKGTGGFNKQGGGAIVFGGANTFTGTTQVLNGVLQLGVAGTGAATLGGPVVVTPTATLSVQGADTISGALTNQGTLKMNGGSSLQLGGDFSGTAASTLQIEGTAAGTPQITSQGAVTLGGALTVQLDAGTYASGTYQLVSGSSVTGSFSTMVLNDPNIAPAKATLSYTGTAVVLTIVAPPLPKPIVTLTATPTTTTVGSNVALQLGVAGSNGVATGQVTLLDGGVAIGTVTLDGSGNAVLNTSALALGTHTITASYGGDKDYSAASSTAVVVTITAPVAVVSVGVSAPATTAGSPVTFTVSVAGSSPNAPLPTGTVTLSDGGVLLGTVTLNGSGGATFTTSTLGPGSHTITVTYGGDTNYTGSPVTVTTTVTITAAVLTPKVTLKATPTITSQGSVVSLVSTVIGTTAVVPTGKMTFVDGATPLGTVNLDAGGSAVLNTTSLAAGTHVITPNYGGDTVYSAASGPSVSVTINAAGTGAGGTGGAADFTLSSDTSTILMQFGAAQSAKLQVSPINGFSQVVGLSCPGLPSTLQCTFAPASVAANGTPVGSVLTITSTPTVPYKIAMEKVREEQVTRAALGGVGFVLSVPVLFVLSLQRRRTVLRKLLVLFLFVSCAGAFELLTGCGCGIQATSETNMVTVQAVSGALQHTVTVTVTTTQ